MDLFGERRDFRIVQMLVKSGACITEPDSLGNTPLSYASDKEQEIILGMHFFFEVIIEGFFISIYHKAWARAVDVLIITEDATEDIQFLEYYLRCHSFIWYFDSPSLNYSTCEYVVLIAIFIFLKIIAKRYSLLVATTAKCWR